MSTLTRASLNRALPPGKAGGGGGGGGRFSENRRVVVVRGVAPSLLTLSPASGGERNGRSLALRARRVYLNEAEARA